MSRQGKKTAVRRKRNKLSTRMMYRRLLIVFGAIVLFCILMIVRIIRLDLNQGADYERTVLKQQSYVSNPIPAKRGDILDRNGNKLAVSSKAYNLILDPKTLLSDSEFLDPTAEALEKTIGLKRKKLQKILKKHSNSQYYLVREYKGLSKDVKKAFEELADKNSKIQGVWFETAYVRKYPYSTVASNLLGFCASDSTGIQGLEKQYNSTLSGTQGKSYGYYDSDLNLIKTVKEATDGNTLVSTIDVNVQGVLEQHMQTFQKETGSEHMGVIIMNPKNGEIYAMASSPGYDLNNPYDLTNLYSEAEQEKLKKQGNTESELQDALWENFCIRSEYEPGSTFKPFTVAACLDEGTTTPGRSYVCDGFQKVGGVTIKCVAYSKGGHGTVNICQALMESCNDALMQLSADLGGKKFLQYEDAYGFGKVTGIDLPDETTGTIFTKDTLHSTELATSSFGQGQTVTMIQMAAAFSSVINGGNYYKPHVIKEIQNESGAVTESIDDTLVRKVVTEKTSKRLRNYLYKTVEEGTASPAKVKGYEIGGKTGTAETLNEKGQRDHKNYVVSFIGFTPVDDPEVVIYTVIERPHVADQAHSTYATEFSSQVMEDVLPLLGIYKSSGKSTTDITLPSTKNGNLIEEVPEGGYSSKAYNTAEPAQTAEATAEPDAEPTAEATAEPDAEPTTEPTGGPDEEPTPEG